MISFRFHVVSITAIFLAIAIGVVVGSTYIDGAVVDGLRNRIDTVESNLDDLRADNSRLEGELGSARDFIGLSADYAVTDRLNDVPVLLVAIRGVDESAVERMVVLARRAGGTVPGILWVEPRWGLDGDDDRAALAEIVDGSLDDDAARLWASAWEAVASELSTDEGGRPSGGGGEGTTATTIDAESSVLGRLEAESFVSVDPLDDATVSLAELAGVSPRVLVVTGAQAREELVPIVPVIVEAIVQASLPTVVADIHAETTEGPGRGKTLTQSLSEGLQALILLADHADREEGRVASVLALDEAGDGQVGLHYGYGDGADAVLPGWTSP